MKRIYYLIIAAMIILTPLGLLADGTAWGEWGADDLTKDLGYVPQGIEKAGEWWSALFPDYSVSQLGEIAHADQIGYVLSALLGSVIIFGIVFVLGKMLAYKDQQRQQNLNRPAE